MFLRHMPLPLGYTGVGVEGIEPTFSVYQTDFLPLKYTPVRVERIELPLVACKATALPLNYTRQDKVCEGIEPSSLDRLLTKDTYRCLRATLPIK
jgi:hypothetical protein